MSPSAARLTAELMLRRGSADGKEPLPPGASAFGPHPFDTGTLYSISPDIANKIFTVCILHAGRGIRADPEDSGSAPCMGNY